MSQHPASPDQSDPPSPLPPDCAHRFELVRALGRGGCGVVFLARQRALDRPAAVKVLASPLRDDTEQVARFLNEARVAAAIEHPAVVRIYDHGAQEGVPWIAYEYVTGGSLRDRLEGGPLDLQTALRACIQVAGALEAAHARDVLHRDIKPDNVLVSDTGLFKVADFGISTWIHEGAVRTATGVIIGTPAYLAPELAAGERATISADVYALGVMLFELVTGQLPYAAPSAPLLLARHSQGSIPLPSSRRAGLPAALDAIVVKALARSKRDRHASVAELGRALAALLDAGVGRHSGDVVTPRGKPEGASAATAVLAPAGARAAESAPTIPVAAAVERALAQPGAAAMARSRRKRAASEAGAKPGIALGHLARAATGLVLAAAALSLGVHSMHSRTASTDRGPAPLPSGVTGPGLAVALVPPAASAASTHPGIDAVGDEENPFAESSEPPPRPPGTYTGWQKGYERFLVPLAKGGSAAAGAVATLAKQVGLKFGADPVLWSHWIRLNVWLRAPVGSWSHAEDGLLALAVGAVANGQVEDGDKPYLTLKLVGSAFRVIQVAPGDGPWWLLLGRVLEMDGQDGPARVAYRTALELLKGKSLDIGYPLVWAGLARALLLLEGPDALVRKWRAFYPPGARAGVSLWGLRLALRPGEPHAEVRTAILDALKADPNLGCDALIELGLGACRSRIFVGHRLSPTGS